MRWLSTEKPLPPKPDDPSSSPKKLHKKPDTVVSTCNSNSPIVRWKFRYASQQKQEIPCAPNRWKKRIPENVSYRFMCV